MILSCYLVPILELLSNKSSVYAIVSTTSFLEDTNLVLRLIGIAAWRGVNLKVKEEDQLQDGIMPQSWPEMPLRKLYLLGTNTKRANLKNPGCLWRECINF